MKIEVLEYESEISCACMVGLGLSYGITSDMSIDDYFRRGLSREKEEKKDKLRKRMYELSIKLAHAGNGENKFLRQVPVVLDITAPMYWWKEFDTYKIGTTAQSESTMHTLLKSPITQDNFESSIPEDTLAHLEDLRVNKKFSELINELPMGWLQRRIVTCNYAVLQNMYNQRKNHKLPEWSMFCEAILEGVDQPEWIDKDYKPETEAE